MMKRLFSALLCTFIAASALCVNSFAASANDLPDYTDESQAGVIVDLTDGEYLDADEIEELEEILGNTAENVGFNIGVIITDDIPDAEDYETDGYQEDIVEEYANHCFDEIFEDDGILLLINYHTLYDYVLSDGSAQDYINDSEIEEIFNAIEPAMSDYDTHGEIESFANEISDICLGGDYGAADGTISADDGYSFTGIIMNIISIIISILGGLVR